MQWISLPKYGHPFSISMTKFIYKEHMLILTRGTFPNTHCSHNQCKCSILTLRRRNRNAVWLYIYMCGTAISSLLFTCAKCFKFEMCIRCYENLSNIPISVVEGSHPHPLSLCFFPPEVTQQAWRCSICNSIFPAFAFYCKECGQMTECLTCIQPLNYSFFGFDGKKGFNNNCNLLKFSQT